MEWVGLILLVALILLAGLSIVRPRLPGALAGTIADKLTCAVRLSDACDTDSGLVSAYGPELAAELSANAPEIAYEKGSTAVPVDFRSCRGAGCGNGPDSGAVWRSNTGEPAVAFTHVVDCRPGSDHSGYDCADGRAGHVYIQYWLYYEDSSSLRDVPGKVGFHQDDWESYQVRLGDRGVASRASSHHGYDYDGGPTSWLSDAGVLPRSAWGKSTGRLFVSGGSHAGHVHGSGGRSSRWTPRGKLRLIPIESLDGRARAEPFAIAPPWRKEVYRDPESEET